MRFFAENVSEAKNILSHLKKIYDERTSGMKMAEGPVQNSRFVDYFVYFTFQHIIDETEMFFRSIQFQITLDVS